MLMPRVGSEDNYVVDQVTLQFFYTCLSPNIPDYVVSSDGNYCDYVNISWEEPNDSDDITSYKLYRDGDFITTFGTDTFYLLNETDATDADRPLEGDLVYHPVLGKMFEIGFVDHDAPFHQLDNNPIYKLRCRQYEYDMSRLDTGIAAIDSIEDSNSTDALVYQFTLENEIGSLQLENDADTGLAGYLISEEYIIGDMDTDKSAQNEFITQQITNENILDFSEKNPFGDAGA